MYTLDTMADEEINLKDALIRSLNEEGILPRLEAQLKAAVYLALEKHNYAEGISPSNQSIRSLWSTEDGLIIASLLVDFLNVMKLENTLNVLMHEAQMKHLDLFDSDKLRSLLTPERTSSNSPLLLNLVETLKHFRNLKLDDTDSSPSVSNNSRNNSRSQVSDETLYSPSRIGNSFSKMKEVSNTLQEAPQETGTNYGNRLQMRTTVTGSLNSPRPSTPTSPTSSNIGKTESPGRASSGASSPSVVRVYAPVKKQLSLNDDKSDVDDDDDIEEVLKAEESVADDTVDQTVDSEQSLGLDYVEEVQALQNPV
ncbi:FGFR1 oncogene partner [Schistosoma japonicum]|uniref:FGFR1 oncogene partner n=1 Tax=Schistosoma japonicum TaxID=6182 RepID=A0A4Z2DU64_SCHJA|nr:FGFR1 oncogene partner [Schistosoma japonicum]